MICRHNAGALGIVKAVHAELPNVTNIAFFDSSFHATVRNIYNPTMLHLLILSLAPPTSSDLRHQPRARQKEQAPQIWLPRPLLRLHHSRSGSPPLKTHIKHQHNRPSPRLRRLSLLHLLWPINRHHHGTHTPRWTTWRNAQRRH